MPENNYPSSHVSPSHVSPLTSDVTEDEINLLDYWRVIVKRKVLVGGIVLVSKVASVIYSLILSPMFASMTRASG